MVLIGLGGNLPSQAGAPAQTIEAALAALAAGGCRVLACSPLYRTAPVPISDQPWFVNAVAHLATDLGPAPLLAALMAVERQFGRVRGVADAARTLDLDLLAYDEVCQDAPSLVLPHPRLHERAFVLKPLADVAPDWRHPRLGRTARELLAALPADQAVAPMPLTPPNL